MKPTDDVIDTAQHTRATVEAMSNDIMPLVEYLFAQRELQNMNAREASLAKAIVDVMCQLHLKALAGLP